MEVGILWQAAERRRGALAAGAWAAGGACAWVSKNYLPGTASLLSISCATPGTPSSNNAGSAPAAKPVPAGPSFLSREGKPPSRRFFSRVRTDSSRDKAKAAKEAAAGSTAAMQPTMKQKLIYRRTWGPKVHRRPR